MINVRVRVEFIAERWIVINTWINTCIRAGTFRGHRRQDGSTLLPAAG